MTEFDRGLPNYAVEGIPLGLRSRVVFPNIDDLEASFVVSFKVLDRGWPVIRCRRCSCCRMDNQTAISHSIHIFTPAEKLQECLRRLGLPNGGPVRDAPSVPSKPSAGPGGAWKDRTEASRSRVLFHYSTGSKHPLVWAHARLS